MAWTCNIMPKLFKDNGSYKFKAFYAGAPGQKDNPDYEYLINKEPLPRGEYRIVGFPFNHKKMNLLTPAPVRHR